MPSQRSAALVLLCVIGAMSTAWAGDARLRAEIEEPFEFDGRVFAPGLLEVVEVEAFTPGLSMCELYIGGRPVGRIIGAVERHDRPETAGAFVLLARNAEGTLVLLGHSDGNAVHRYRRPSKDVPEAMLASL